MTWEIYATGSLLARIRVDGGYIYAVMTDAGNIDLHTSLLFVPDLTKEKENKDD